MEAEESRSADEERSSSQQQPLSEALLGAELPPLQQQATSQPVHGSHGRLQHRQPKRFEMLQRQKKQQQSQASGSSWQLSDVPGPSRGSSSVQGDPSPQAHNVPQTQSGSLEVQEGIPSRRERKPQKPGKYVCTYCGRPCAKPSVLQKHIRSHTGERPYPCVPCGFSFKTKSNLYKHRKSHAHRIKAGMVSSREEPSFSGVEGGALGDEQEEGTEGESTGSEDETGQHQPSTSQGRPTLKKGCKVELSFVEEGPQTEDSQAVKQRLAMRLSERKRTPRTSSDETRSSLGPGSKGSTESGYFSRSGSAELSQVSPPNASAKTYAEIILGKYGRLGQQQRIQQQQLQLSSSGQQEKSIPFTVPKTQVIEHITKLITINEAVVDTSEIDSVKPRRSSLSRRSSIESVKMSSPKEPFVFESKGNIPGSCGSALQLIPGSFTSELSGSYLADTETLACQSSSGILYRSQSMPSSGDTSDIASHRFRLSHSFDEQQAIAAEMRIGSHHRMLRRQPAIEMPVGTDLIIEDAGPSSRLTESDLGKKHEKELHLYECEICGTRLKKQDSYAAHRLACMSKSPLGPRSEEGSSFENQPQVMSYKFKAMAMAVRKRKKKEESLEEDPPSPGPTAVSFSSQSSSVMGSIDHQGKPCAILQAELERRGSWKEISVIQHTRSFEKQESISMGNQETDLKHEPSQEPKSATTSRLIRQPNIQVPEILVTEEPDTEMTSPTTSTYTSKEPEKVEEFQWPQRSQSLAQLPAEKLPPKKKRLRLAEAAQSSGESSFESVSLPHSPSQESSISHVSSRSTSFEETGRTDSEMQTGTWSSQATHMLTVPSSHHQQHHSHREMRRSTSEQAPASPSHPAHVEETRSKSFDYGSLSVERTSATWKERRKYLLVKHATLGEPDQEEPSSAFKSGGSAVCQSYLGNPPLKITDYRMGGGTSALSSEHIGKTMKLFQPPLPLPQAVVTHTSPDFCSSNQLTRFLPVTTAISGVLSTQMFQQPFIHGEPPQLHQRPLEYVERLGVPLHPLPTLFPQPSGDVTQAVCFPIPGGLTIQVPSGPLFRESRTSPSSLQSPGHSQQQVVIPHTSHPIISPCLQQLTPVVSLVVPVRLQTHIPTYASAMYTTISQILATTQRPVCCTAMVIMGKMEEDKLQRSYLRLPSPDPKSYIPLPLPLEYGAGTSSEDSCGQLGAGGSKRMLSPAGSLELSLEAQRHQKRVKEEEEEKEDKDDKHNKCDEKSQEGCQGKNKQRLIVETVGRNKDAVEVEETKKLSKQDITEHKTKHLHEEERKEVGHKYVPGVESPKRGMEPSYPTLHTATSVSWCYLNYIKPNPSTHQDSTSVYSSWSVSMHNPNLPGLSTKTLLSLLHSKQKHSAETYTMATAPPPNTDKVEQTGCKKADDSEVCAPPPSTPAKVKEESTNERKEKEKTTADDEPTTSTQSETSRISIFEGGYKSNEDYVYVRGRGRGKYVCGECGIRCKKPSMLKKHIRTHTDVRPYVCKHCNFAFKTKGNLTKHMKSKAHGKKCLEMGVSESSVDELETEEAGGSEEHLCESEDQEEHQFSDGEGSEAEEDDDEEEDLSSHDDPSSACSTDTRQSTGDLSECGQGPHTEPFDPKEEYSSPHRPWPGVRAASPGSKRASFSRKGWEVSPRTFSPSSEGSPLRSLSPRLDLSSPSRHLSPSPERGPSPIRALSPLRPISPLRPVSPRQYRNTRALSSPTPLKPQHRPHSSPAGLHWEPSTPATEGQQDKPCTQSTLQERMPPDPCLLSPALRFSPSETFPPTPVTPRTVDRMFSHLPLHSQDQARMPYHMIPIGGIQMVQLRPRSRPKLERQSSSTPSPTSPKEDFLFSPARRDFPWISLPETSPQRPLVDSRAHSQDNGARRSDLSCPSTSSTLHRPPALQKGVEEQQTAKVRKQYSASSSATKTHTCGPEKCRKAAPDSDERADKISQGEGASSSQETRQLHETKKSVVAPLRGRGSSSDGYSGQQSGTGTQSPEGDPDST